MRAVIQRTTHARVVIAGKLQAEIQTGMLILAGVSRTDTERQAEYLAERIPKLRIFEDSSGKMNHDIQQAGGSLLVVPNFTLYADVTRGKRPGFDQAMRPERAKPLFEHLVERLRVTGLRVETGVFGADMQVELRNDGPVTLVMDAD